MYICVFICIFVHIYVYCMSEGGMTAYFIPAHVNGARSKILGCCCRCSAARDRTASRDRKEGIFQIIDQIHTHIHKYTINKQPRIFDQAPSTCAGMKYAGMNKSLPPIYYRPHSLVFVYACMLYNHVFVFVVHPHSERLGRKRA